MATKTNYFYLGYSKFGEALKQFSKCSLYMPRLSILNVVENKSCRSWKVKVLTSSVHIWKKTSASKGSCCAPKPHFAFWKLSVAVNFLSKLVWRVGRVWKSQSREVWPRWVSEVGLVLFFCLHCCFKKGLGSLTQLCRDGQGLSSIGNQKVCKCHLLDWLFRCCSSINIWERA